MTRNALKAGMLYARSAPPSFHYAVLKISWMAANTSRLNTIFSQLFRVKDWKWNMYKECEGDGFSKRIAEVIVFEIWMVECVTRANSKHDNFTSILICLDRIFSI